MKTFIVYVDRLVKYSYEVKADSEKEAIKLYREDKAGEGEEYEAEDQQVYAECEE